MSAIKMEGLVGFEPTIRELQSHALPLGYRPIPLDDIINFTLINFLCQLSLFFIMELILFKYFISWLYKNVSCTSFIKLL